MVESYTNDQNRNNEEEEEEGRTKIELFIQDFDLNMSLSKNCEFSCTVLSFLLTLSQIMLRRY